MTQRFLVPPGTPVNLTDYDPGYTGNYTSKDETKAELNCVYGERQMYKALVTGRSLSESHTIPEEPFE